MLKISNNMGLSKLCASKAAEAKSYESVSPPSECHAYIA